MCQEESSGEGGSRASSEEKEKWVRLAGEVLQNGNPQRGFVCWEALGAGLGISYWRLEESKEKLKEIAMVVRETVFCREVRFE